MNKNIAIKAENISKQYRLGQVGTGTITHDLNRWYHKIRGKEDPYLKIGESNDRSTKGTSEYVWSLRDINFEIEKGDAVGIIGRNGAGKSTLLKLLSKVTQPTTGRFLTQGRIASLLEVGTGFHPEMTGRENIYLNGAILGMTRKEITRKFDEIVDFSGVERYIDTPVKRYSSGMYVRLAFAVAAHLESEILIVDEVLAVGDAEFQKKCLGKMGDVTKGEGRTVLFVSHNMAAVKQLCNKGIVLEKGELTFSGNQELASNYYLNQNVKSSKIKIKDRLDILGNKKIEVNDIYFKNINNIRISELIVGESYRLIIDFTLNNSNINLDSFIFMIQIMNQDDKIITTIGTDEMGIKFNEIPNVGQVEINIQKLNLRSGRYSIHYLFSEHESIFSNHNIINSLTHALFFDVITSDYYNVGFMLRNNGYVQDATIKII